jgi:hypothetical protein
LLKKKGGRVGVDAPYYRGGFITCGMLATLSMHLFYTVCVAHPPRCTVVHLDCGQDHHLR